MSAISFETEKQAARKRRSLARRLVYGPALVLALAVGSSGVLVVALLLSAILEF